MKLFSDEYLMHYGVKGMKWKKKKKFQEDVPHVGSPEEYLDEAYRDIISVGGADPKKWTRFRRNVESISNSSQQKDVDAVRETANTRRRNDLRAAREVAYRNNQRRIARQQAMQKALRKAKKKKFTSRERHVTNHAPVPAKKKQKLGANRYNRIIRNMTGIH